MRLHQGATKCPLPPAGGRHGCADPQRGHGPIRTLDPWNPVRRTWRAARTPMPMTGQNGFRRAHPSALPVTGAWRPAIRPGIAGSSPSRPSGPSPWKGRGLLRGVTVAYETWGELAPAANAVLVCHALTGDSHAAGGSALGTPRRVVGRHRRPGRRSTRTAGSWCASTCWAAARAPPARPRPIPTTASRGGSLPGGLDAGHGPHPGGGGRPPGRVRWALVVGGSMGGMQALEWGVMYPERVRRGAPSPRPLASAAQIAWWSAAAGRSAWTRGGGAATTTTPPPATGPTRAWPRG